MGPEHPDVAFSLDSLALALKELGRYEEAHQMLTRAVRLREKKLGAEHPRVATLLGGGYHASGAAGRDRLPQPHLPPGLRLDPMEGAGEVQTPLLGPPAARLRVGDRVYLRHAKAGELCERFDSLHLVSGGRVVDEVGRSGTSGS